MGGVVGIGTLIITFFAGPFIQFTRKLLAPFLKKILGAELVDSINQDDEKFEKEVIA